MNISKAQNPRYTASGDIDLDIDLDGQQITFTASPTDSEAHGRDLYARAVAGEFGAAAPYVAPVETLAKRRAALAAACAASILAGFDSPALGAPHHYPSGDTDQRNLLGSVIASVLPGVDASWTTPFWCADSAGTWAFRPHTATQIQQVGQAAKAAVVAAQALLAEQLAAVA